MKIEILCTGDEVLSGATVNTNFSHISQKLGDAGLPVLWGTTVGDDRDTLLRAFRQAAERADAIIVNGGLGPTVDDLSQEMAAQAAGVELEFHEPWFHRMEEFFQRRARVMPHNNRKQAMLPAGAELLDNPIGTACGFALDIGRARFFFTPGVPRELHRMLDEQILPRLLARAGTQTAVYLKRFHSYGVGESRADAMLEGLEALQPDGSLKLGFRAHYPQLETKLTARGIDRADIDRKLTPAIARVRHALGNFIVSEDNQKLEDVLLESLGTRKATLATLESFTGGALAARLAPLPAADGIFRRGLVAREAAQVRELLGLSGAGGIGPELARDAAKALRSQAGTTHALVSLIALDEGADRLEFGGDIHIAIASEHKVDQRRARLLGGREWVRMGALEMSLDCLRRHLLELPIDERIDFEKT
ncbi:MAG: CinA family nicotinamide mononucleotide deamidase-related protein [Betaproteobacteria bacterium]|nr:CinA family nicotinamide mononucleotide deamidase-related protein [Betaproteobacteria bacterium]